jgi:hypothetical protein
MIQHADVTFSDGSRIATAYFETKVPQTIEINLQLFGQNITIQFYFGILASMIISEIEMHGKDCKEDIQCSL